VDNVNFASAVSRDKTSSPRAKEGGLASTYVRTLGVRTLLTVFDQGVKGQPDWNTYGYRRQPLSHLPSAPRSSCDRPRRQRLLVVLLSSPLHVRFEASQLREGRQEDPVARIESVAYPFFSSWLCRFPACGCLYGRCIRVMLFDGRARLPVTADNVNFACHVHRPQHQQQ
jgi:hypothetical protein